jgi:hypothetical protein
MREGRRFRFLLAMNCQVAAEAADGTEVPYSGAPAVQGQMREGRRFRFLLAMNCQVAAEAADGTKVPCSGAPAVREYGAVLPTDFWGLRPSMLCTFVPNPSSPSA